MSEHPSPQETQDKTPNFNSLEELSDKIDQLRITLPHSADAFRAATAERRNLYQKIVSATAQQLLLTPNFLRGTFLLRQGARLTESAGQGANPYTGEGLYKDVALNLAERIDPEQ